MENDGNTTIKEAFQEPRKRFWMRSRKRPKSDAISISSMDMSIESEVGKKKKRRRITEVASSIFSATTITNKQSTLHRSFIIQPSTTDLSFIDNDTNTDTLRKKRNSGVESSSAFTLKSWVLDVAKTNNKDWISNTLSGKEIKRQEAIYELYCGENVLLNDLEILKNFYYEPLVQSDIFTAEEMFTLFSDIKSLIEIHSRLRDDLLNLRDQYGCTETVGPTILNWIPTLTKPYLERCRTQIWAKHLLDEKRLTNKRFQTFLKKRLESPHSVDLWTHIDVARSRIVKYPLLVKEILRHTSLSHSDQTCLKDAHNLLSDLLQNIDQTMGVAECKLAKFKINVKLDYDLPKCIKNASELITEGQLRDGRGMKYQCFLFDTCFAMTRRARSMHKKYNLSFPVIPTKQISLDAEDDAGFKICDHLLITEDGHGKRHWIDCFNKALQKGVDITENTTDGNEKENHSNFIDLKVSKSPKNNLSGNHFSMTLKRSLMKQKHSSTAYT